MNTKTLENKALAPPAKHGGKRARAGRKPRKGAADPAPSAYEYLGMVARGEIEPDSLRVTASRALLAYEAPRQRAPVKGLSPTAARQSEAASADADQSAQWALTVQKIKAKHGRASP